MVEDKIFNSSFDEVEYGTERTQQTAINIHSDVTDQYEDTTAVSIEDLYTKRKMRDEMAILYETSPFYEKYEKNPKKIERCDLSDIYYYFKGKFKEMGRYNIVQIFCAIAEFFELNYKTLYNDVVSLEDKVEILDTLEETFGLESHFVKSKKLF